MKRSFFLSFAIGTLLSAISATQSQGVENILLFNTGVDASAVVLPDGTLGDPHYTLTVFAPDTSSIIRVKTSDSGYPVGPWVGDDLLSAWIGPNGFEASPAELNGHFGEYFFETTFDLTGLDPLTAEISGLWSADNVGVDILLNGVSTGNSTPLNSFDVWTPFSISDGFLPGLNLLEFHVHNEGGSVGVRVEMTGTANAVPEPSTLALGGMGFAFGAVFIRRRVTRVMLSSRIAGKRQ